MLETTEMKVVRKIAYMTLIDEKMSEGIIRMCQIDNINQWIWQSNKNGMNTSLARMTTDQ